MLQYTTVSDVPFRISFFLHVNTALEEEDYEVRVGSRTALKGARARASAERRRRARGHVGSTQQGHVASQPGAGARGGQEGTNGTDTGHPPARAYGSGRRPYRTKTERYRYVVPPLLAVRVRARRCIGTRNSFLRMANEPSKFSTNFCVCRLPGDDAA